MEYTVIGDTVNLASRIESKAARGQIYISESTFERIKEQVYAIKMQPTYVKGKEEPITIYSIRGYLDREYNEQTYDRITIPVSYIDQNNEKHNGLLLGVAIDGDILLLQSHFKVLFEENSTVQLLLNLPEISDAQTLVCKVRSYTIINPEQNIQFYNYIFEAVQENEILNSLLQNKIIDGTVAVDNIVRE